jgi:hypothetical protein
MACISSSTTISFYWSSWSRLLCLYNLLQGLSELVSTSIHLPSMSESLLHCERLGILIYQLLTALYLQYDDFWISLLLTHFWSITCSMYGVPFRTTHLFVIHSNTPPDSSWAACKLYKLSQAIHLNQPIWRLWQPTEPKGGRVYYASKSPLAEYLVCNMWLLHLSCCQATGPGWETLMEVRWACSSMHLRKIPLCI